MKKIIAISFCGILLCMGILKGSQPNSSQSKIKGTSIEKRVGDHEVPPRIVNLAMRTTADVLQISIGATYQKYHDGEILIIQGATECEWYVMHLGGICVLLEACL